jgi:putative transposase
MYPLSQKNLSAPLYSFLFFFFFFTLMIDSNNAFLKRLVKQFDEPKVVVTDKAPSITSAFKKLKEYGFYQGTEHRTIKYLNNLIEQDHRPVKRRNKFYRSLRTASTTIKGMEAIRGLYKKTRKEGTLFGFSVPVLKSRYYWESQLKS